MMILLKSRAPTDAGPRALQIEQRCARPHRLQSRTRQQTVGGLPAFRGSGPILPIQRGSKSRQPLGDLLRRGTRTISHSYFPGSTDVCSDERACPGARSLRGKPEHWHLTEGRKMEGRKIRGCHFCHPSFCLSVNDANHTNRIQQIKGGRPL